VTQLPNSPFPLPADWQLRAEENVTLAFPKALVGDDEPIGSVIKCHDDAHFGFPPDQEVIFARLARGMVLSLSRSSHAIVVAEDGRPRQFALLKPKDAGD
jgi:hypothetical protein